jgi:hypothetical protein
MCQCYGVDCGRDGPECMGFGPPDKKPTILEEAGSLVDGPREAAYGHPKDDFSAVVHAAYALGVNPTEHGGDPLHHALYMILVKIQRLVQTPDHRDSIVDIAGYARCYEKVLERSNGVGE